MGYHGTVVSFPPGAGSNGVTHVVVGLQRGEMRTKLRSGDKPASIRGRAGDGQKGQGRDRKAFSASSEAVASS